MQSVYNDVNCFQLLNLCYVNAAGVYLLGSLLGAGTVSLGTAVGVGVVAAPLAVWGIYEHENFSGINQRKRYHRIAAALKKGPFREFTVVLVDAPHVTAQTLKALEKFLSNEKKVPVEKIGKGGSFRIYFSPYNRNVWIDMHKGRKFLIVRSSSIKSANVPRVDHFIKIPSLELLKE